MELCQRKSLERDVVEKGGQEAEQQVKPGLSLARKEKSSRRMGRRETHQSECVKKMKPAAEYKTGCKNTDCVSGDRSSI